MSHGHDDWHQHTPEEGVPQEEHGSTVSSNALGITMLAIIFGVAFVIIILTAYFQHYTDTYKAEKQEGIPAARADYITARATAESRLGSAGAVNRDTGVFRIPMDRAAELVASEYAREASQGSANTNTTLTAEDAPSDDAS